MPLSRETLEKRVVKAGVKASRKLDRVVSPDELLALRVQTMPAIPRGLLVLLGIALIACCWFSWPADSGAVRGIEAICGIISLLFGLFGIRRTLSHTLDSLDALDLAGNLLEMVVDAVSNIDL